MRRYLSFKIFGNKLEINLPVETTGKIVEVLVLLPESKKNPRRSVMDILREIQGKGIFSSPEEVNQYLQKERSEKRVGWVSSLNPTLAGLVK